MKKSILVVVLVAFALLVGCIIEHVHVFDQEVVSEKYLASEATPTAAATYYKSCICGERGTETFSIGSPVASKWSGEVAKREILYDVDSSVGFLKKDAGGKTSLAETFKDKDEACIANAKAFISWYKGKFIDTGEIEIKVDGEEKDSNGYRISYVTLYSADALASLELLQGYFAAECIVRAVNGNYLFNVYLQN